MAEKILVVDDQEMNRMILKIILKKMNYDFDEADNGFEAVEKIKNNEYDSILLDLMMPKMDGYSVLKELKLIPHFITPVIVISALDDINDISKALNLGAYDYLPKPLDKKVQNIILPLKLKNAVTLHRREKQILEENRRMQTELDQAAEIQNRLVPDSDIKYKSMQINSFFLPSKGIGGDFFNIYEIDENKTGILLADVSGHGLAASIFAAMAGTLFSSFSKEIQAPADLLFLINNKILNFMAVEYFIQGFYGVYDKNKKQFIFEGAGFLPFLFKSNSTNEVHEINTQGTLLNVMKDFEYKNQVIDIEPGDKIFLYTDGIVEQTKLNTNEQYSFERLKQVLIDDNFSNTSFKKIMRDLKRFSMEDEFEDDITMLQVEFK